MKVSVSTSLEESEIIRIERLVEKDLSHSAAILRKAIIRGLPLVEAEVLGAQFAGKPVGRRKQQVAA